MLRVWAYHWQKLHAAEQLALRRGGKITKEQFVERGLPFYEPSVQREFRRRGATEGDESALRFIGKQAADETNFLYTAQSQPGWMQTSFGKLASTFGNWPMWQFELYRRRLLLGTPTQKMMFLTRTAGVAGAVGTVAYATGTSLGNWLSPTEWFQYFGGPFIDVSYDLREFVTAPWERKSSAAGRLASQTIQLGVPGRGFVRDVHQSVNVFDVRAPEIAAFSMFIGRMDKVDSNVGYEMLFGGEGSLPPGAFRNVATRRQREANIANNPITSPLRPPRPEGAPTLRQLGDSLRAGGILDRPALPPPSVPAP